LEPKTLGQIARSSTPKFATAGLRRRRFTKQKRKKRKTKDKKKANGHEKTHVRKKTRLREREREREREMDDTDKCASSLIGIPVKSRESLVMRTNERTTDMRRAKEQQPA
jgi:hypothetical protein